jgi:hypothetical protein
LPNLIFGHRSVTRDEDRAFGWLRHHDHETDRCDYQAQGRHRFSHGAK